MLEQVLILGGCGGFGRAFSKQLNRQNIVCTSVDVAKDADIVCDILSQPKVLVEALEKHDVLLMCTAEPTTMAALIATFSDRPVWAIWMISRSSAAACTKSGTPADSRPNSRQSPSAKAKSV